MAQSALEQMGVQIDETARKASRATPGAAECVGFAVHARIALLYAAIAAAAEQFARTRKQRRSNGNAAFGNALSRFL
jgi:hypothetical protein